MRETILAVSAVLFLVLAGPAAAACRDAVVLVHGNTGKPSDFDNTYVELRARGYAAAEIFRPDWGSKTCAACNDHNGSEETPVRNAMTQALAASCTGRIDVIGHSMGATLAAKQIVDLGIRPRVHTFVGIAGAFRGLWTCGTYPWHVWNSACGYWGLSVNSPFLNWLYGKRFGDRIYSIKSWSDQVVCATGVCTVGGIHSSSIWNENGSYTYALGHFGLLAQTQVIQADLIQ
ncbi:MAG TPA: alpha/beta fold hydrolase [Xanthomonadaceae bacterium]|nr:alpha/beta fold hydrolase [Xanthomonadaceae bacterium]